jgi:hypothetical protein
LSGIDVGEKGDDVRRGRMERLRWETSHTRAAAMPNTPFRTDDCVVSDGQREKRSTDYQCKGCKAIAYGTDQERLISSGSKIVCRKNVDSPIIIIMPAL